jgi:hypothetical protein
MQGDRQKLVNVLKAELAFLESGGYWSVSCPSWRAPLIFEDSPTCLRSSGAPQPSPCSECVLAPLVPEEHLLERFPCRHIPLNEKGETLDSLYHVSSQEKVESAVARWLRAKVSELQDSEPGTAISSSVGGKQSIRARPL